MFNCMQPGSTDVMEYVLVISETWKLKIACLVIVMAVTDRGSSRRGWTLSPLRRGQTARAGINRNAHLAILETRIFLPRGRRKRKEERRDIFRLNTLSQPVSSRRGAGMDVRRWGILFSPTFFFLKNGAEAREAKQEGAFRLRPQHETIESSMPAGFFQDARSPDSKTR